MIPEAAVEAAAKCTYEREMGVNWDDLQSSVKRGYLDDARAALEAAAPHMLADYRAQIELEYTKADERKHMFRSFHEKRDSK